MYSIREAAEVLGVRPRLLRKWMEAGHFPGAVAQDTADGKAWSIPHEAVTEFLRSTRQPQAPAAHLEPVEAAPAPQRTSTSTSTATVMRDVESPVGAAEVMAPGAISLSAMTAVPWPLVQHLLLAESAQRQAWQELAAQHGQAAETLRATLECERDEIIRLRCEVLDLRDELSAARTELARRNHALPQRDWDNATRSTQPMTRTMLAVLTGGR